MPAVSDPGSRLISAVLEAGLTVEVLPGPSAVTAALVASGMARGGFVFAGFLPKSPAAIGRLLDRLDAPGCRSSPSSRRGGCRPRWRRWPSATPPGRSPSAAS